MCRLLALLLGAVLAASATARTGCKGYADDLALMVDIDQALRRHWDLQSLAVPPGPLPAAVRRSGVADREHARRLRAWVRRCGWPDAAGLGAAWLLVQHADHDRALQRAFFAHLRSRPTAGAAWAGEAAYLSDRLDLAEGRPQRHGTQLVPRGPCTLDFLPLDDRARVEARRRALGWPPLDDYLRLVSQQLLPAHCARPAP